MKHWVFTAFGDALGLEQRLNQLADSGLELVTEEDGMRFFGAFEPTSRQDLRYYVEPAPLLRSDSQALHRVEELRKLGWDNLCTLNGLDVYVAAPLRFPNRPELRVSRTYGVLSLLGVLLSVALCALLPGSEWYIHNYGVFLRLTGGIFLPFGGIWALWRAVRLIVPPQKAAPPFWVLTRSVCSALWCLWWPMLAVSVVLTLLPLLWAMVTLLLGLLLRLRAGIQHNEEGKTCWHAEASLQWRGVCVGMMLLLAIGLHQLGVTSSIQEYAAGSAPWGVGWAVHTNEVMTDPGEAISTEYRKIGSLLVSRESYVEVTEGQHLECQRYSCLFPPLNAVFLEQWKAQLPTVGETYSVTMGRRTLLLWCALPCDRNPQLRMEELLKP